MRKKTKSKPPSQIEVFVIQIFLIKILVSEEVMGQNCNIDLITTNCCMRRFLRKTHKIYGLNCPINTN